MNQKTVQLAYRLSRLYGHSYVGTEHLLPALTMQSNPAAQLLRSQLLSARELLGQLLRHWEEEDIQ